MHEVAIAQALVSTMEHSARDAGLARVTRLGIELGPSAGLTPDALAFALQVAGQGTLGEGAEVVFSGAGAALDLDSEEFGLAHARAHALAGDAAPQEGGPAHRHEHSDAAFGNHDARHAHDEHPPWEAGTATDPMDRWTVRLAWIEGN